MIAEYNLSESSASAERAQGKTRTHPSPDNAWQPRFLALLPRIRRHAKLRFRHLSPELREELVQETVARALLDYLRLVERGQEHVACAGPLARFAVAQVRRGRRVGGRLNIADVSSQYCQHHKRVTLESLDGWDETSGGWKEVLVEDRHSTPADIAAVRVDVNEWLKTLPHRSRRLAERLAMGETTSSAARWLGVSRGRVSQLRVELRQAWHAFQGELVPTKW